MNVEFEIENELCVLSQRESGWKKELNQVSWSGKEARFDIREWSPDHSKMGKGITLSEDELYTLFSFLKNYFNDDVCMQPQGNEKDISKLLIREK